MPVVDTYGGNGHLPAIPESISRSSSVTVVSPVVKDGVDEVAMKLVEIGDIIGSLDSVDIGQGLDIGELLQDIHALQAEVESIKLAQNDEIKGIKDGITNNAEKEIAKMLEGNISAMITASLAEHVTQEMETWADEWDAEKFATKLELMLEANGAILEEGRIALENSKSRFRNSYLDLLDDFNAALKPIKRPDGCVSHLFPESLRQLFAYSGTKLLRLLEDYNLHALERPGENLNRFLIFIGINASIPEQLLDSLEEDHPPAYAHGSIPGSLHENDRKSTRRRSSASEKSSNAFVWSSIFS